MRLGGAVFPTPICIAGMRTGTSPSWWNKSLRRRIQIPKPWLVLPKVLVRWKNDKVQIKEKIWLRFVAGNPCSDLTIKYLRWTCSKAHQSGKRVLLMFWDHAPWHISKETMDWVHAHNRQVKHSGKGVRLLICLLPKKSPWLNSIEPMWIHAKRKIVEPDNRLSASEVVSRVCSVFANPVLPFLKKS